MLREMAKVDPVSVLRRPGRVKRSRSLTFTMTQGKIGGCIELSHLRMGYSQSQVDSFHAILPCPLLLYARQELHYPDHN